MQDLFQNLVYKKTNWIIFMTEVGSGSNFLAADFQGIIIETPLKIESFLTIWFSLCHFHHVLQQHSQIIRRLSNAISVHHLHQKTHKFSLIREIISFQVKNFWKTSEKNRICLNLHCFIKLILICIWPNKRLNCIVHLLPFLTLHNFQRSMVAIPFMWERKSKGFWLCNVF